MLNNSSLMKLLIYSLFVIYLLLSSIVSKTYAESIRVPAPRSGFDPVHDYFVELTRLILSKNKHLYSDKKISFVNFKEMTQGRISALLDHNHLDIVWSGTNNERELNYLPIRIPLFRGLLGYRVLLIHQEDKDKFQQIKTPSQLKKLTACQGEQWPDSDILESNGYLVSRVANFNSMYKMVAKKRCDYFPRAIFEGYSEQKSAMKSFPNIIVMDDLILNYKLPFYYFVQKNNTELAQRLESGLITALSDGSFMDLMKSHQVTKHLFPLSQWQKKRYFFLSNEILGIELPLKKINFGLILKHRNLPKLLQSTRSPTSVVPDFCNFLF